MLTEDDADLFAKKVANATNRVVRDYELGDVADEEGFSGQLCGRLKETLEDFSTPAIRWQVDAAIDSRGYGHLSARTLEKQTEEPIFGADIVMTLDVRTDGYEMQKGFLAQAKRLEPDNTLNNRDHRRLLRQCELMVSFTPSSMVFLYSKKGVHVIPATAVLALRGADLWSIVTNDLVFLYREFAICWFGDPRLVATSKATLRGLRELTGVSGALRFKGTTKFPRTRGRSARRD